MEKIVGLDLGVASIGWALIENNEHEPHLSKIIDSGSRIFQGNNKRAEAGSTTSANENRRIKRSARRNRDRTKRRKRKLLHFMRPAGMAPFKDNMDEWFSLNPYKLRAKGLDDELTPLEFGRALYHMNQRRGFKSNRKTPADESDGVVKKEINKLQKDINESNNRTLGEYLYNLSIGNQHSDSSKHTKIRDRYTHRDQYKDEFEKLWSKQKQYCPDLCTKKLKNNLYDTIFYQRPISSQAQFIGKCPLETDKKRIARAHRLYQEFRIFKNVNNLTAFDETGEELLISDKQREAIIEKLMSVKETTFSQLKKVIGWNGNAEFNLERSDKKIKGHATNSALSNSKAFGKRWYEFDTDMQDHIIDVLIHVEKEEVVKDLALNKWGCTQKEADYLATLELEPGYGRYSNKAIKKLLPELRKGTQESTVIEGLGYTLFDKEQGSATELPMPDEIRNPVVYHAMIELRKVVNAIIRKYGMPDKIRVELARELKNGSQRREEIVKKQKKLKKENDRANEALQKAPFNIQNPTYEDRLWYKLWQECEKTCPYTGDSIPASALHANTFEIEHILPFSRSVDDSYMNKTLCRTDINRKKGNRTPFEMFDQDSKEWNEVLQRIRNLPGPKSSRFIRETLEINEFIERQLNDTKYISTLASEYLQKLHTKVEVVKGQTTSIFRRCWELNRILHPESHNVKNRDDHRHHAVDALVVAMTTPHMLQLLATSHRKQAKAHNRYTVGHPWPDFYDQAEKSIKDIIVSHRVQRSIKGALHEESYYGPADKPSSKKDEQWLVMRKPVHQLTKKEVGLNNKTKNFDKMGKVYIRDDKVRSIIQDKIRTFMDDGLSFKKAVEKLEDDPPLIKSEKDKRPIKNIRLMHRKKKKNFAEFDDNEETGVDRYAVYDKKHHIAIYNRTDKKGKVKQEGVVVPMMEAARRAVSDEPIILRDDPDMDKFVMSLSRDEMIIDHETGIFYRLQKMSSTGQMTFREHSSSKTDNSDPAIMRKNPSKLNAKKINVSPIGEIYPAND